MVQSFNFPQTHVFQVLQTYPQDPAVQKGHAGSLGGAVILMMLMMVQCVDNSMENKPDTIRRELVATLFDVDIATGEEEDVCYRKYLKGE